MSEQQALIDAITQQRNDALNTAAHWYSKYVAISEQLAEAQQKSQDLSPKDAS